MTPISTLMAAFTPTTRVRSLYRRLLAVATAWFFVPAGLCAGTKDLPVAPNWSLKNLDGTTVRLSDFRGKVVILDFWTTWCPPCRKEMPGLVELQKRYGARGLVVIGVSLDEETRAVKPVAQSLNVNYPIVFGTPAAAELYGGVAVVPSTFVINREGKVTALHEGYTETVTIEAEIKPLL